MRQKQKAILVGVNLNNQQDFTNSMKELSNLAEACEIEVVGEKSQNLNSVIKAYYIGKGKLQEVLALIQEKKADMVIFNDELSPSQIRNLEATLKCKVIDRTVLILDIFAQRARTREAQLQVEVAKLQYMLPRLIGSGESLGRQGGGAGLKNRGSGETKLELDRRKIEERISSLNKELEILVAQRQNQRKRRKKKEIPVIALVGYTNTGKSTIMNVMLDLFNPTSEKQVFEKNMLFATLETSVRSIELPDNKTFLLTDTVGFISKLPHHLVKAFRSTLEEVAEADLLIHVVDYSNPFYKEQIEVTKETLKELGADNIPVIYAYNKTDLAEVEIPKGAEDNVYLSAKRKTGIDDLVGAIREKAFAHYVCCEMLIPYDKGKVVSYFNDNATIKSTVYESNGVLISMECKEADYERYHQYCLV
ncbi:GTPase HflX [Desulfosporosinus youngiae]|uniref:GTPase HflX n=1 Tax=Desulfosporosinus youngiae DSM 17734 TaxID=768710 RepID=H5Y1J6_9FIRM|nr:GTPase HflX [Desulfosporosinus youngiae]EHQ87609.1 GTP-binding protein HflX [Desulfosporosinus youngiae DSM 17734]